MGSEGRGEGEGRRVVEGKSIKLFIIGAVSSVCPRYGDGWGEGWGQI